MCDTNKSCATAHHTPAAIEAANQATENWMGLPEDGLYMTATDMCYESYNAGFLDGMQGSSEKDAEIANLKNLLRHIQGTANGDLSISIAQKLRAIENLLNRKEYLFIEKPGKPLSSPCG